MLGPLETQTENREPLQPAQVEDGGELAPINAIRIETTISRLPIHQLSKTARSNIRIIRRSDPSLGGQITFRWEVSYNDQYGPPRQLAYKIDKLVIDRRIDEHRKPVPRYIRLGSLHKMGLQLGLGGDTNKVKRALLQNSSTFITAKLTYTTQEGREVHIEEAFTRYNLRFWHETLDDGIVADAVFLRLNDPFLQIVNTSPSRPLDYDYLDRLPPGSSRFYELLSFQMFAALKNQHSFANLRYSEFCEQAPQTRYYDRRHMQIQMATIHRAHLSRGYITRPIRYDQTTDDQGSPDWNILYTPGPKARAEFETFHRKRSHPRVQQTIDVAGVKPQQFLHAVAQLIGRALVGVGGVGKEAPAPGAWLWPA